MTPADRLVWVALSRIWRDWRSALAIVQPKTVIAWHRHGFRLFWTRKVRRGQPGRHAVSREVRDLIRRMSRENPLWRAPHPRESLKLGITIGRHQVHGPAPQTAVTDLAHIPEQSRQDPGVGGLLYCVHHPLPVLYGFLVLAHERRRVVHFNVTAHPSAAWTAQQLREVFPFDRVPRYLLRDRDKIFGDDFRRRVQDMQIQEVLSAPRSPWQQAHVERLIGSIRRECLDHVLDRTASRTRER